MTTLSLRLPDYLHKSVKELAKQEGVSINQLITLAIAEKISALMAEDYIKNRGLSGRRATYEAILAKVPAAEPIEGDKID